MGKKRTITVGETETVKKEKGVRVPGLKGGQRVVAVTAEPTPKEKPATAEAQKKTEAQKKRGLSRAKSRGKQYLAAKIKVDPHKSYPLEEAIKLLKETSFARFDGTAEIHLVTFKPGLQGEVNLPHFQGKTKKIEIANQETLKKIESGKIDFDILLATPAFIPNLVKFAKILGPKGLMPNPKNGTLAEKPEEAIKNFQKTSIPFKTEQKAPLIHAVFGRVSQKEKELEENLQTFLQAVGAKNIKKAVVKGTMGPAIKLMVDNS